MIVHNCARSWAWCPAGEWRRLHRPHPSLSLGNLILLAQPGKTLSSIILFLCAAVCSENVLDEHGQTGARSPALGFTYSALPLVLASHLCQSLLLQEKLRAAGIQVPKLKWHKQNTLTLIPITSPAHHNPGAIHRQPGSLHPLPSGFLSYFKYSSASLLVGDNEQPP